MTTFLSICLLISILYWMRQGYVEVERFTLVQKLAGALAGKNTLELLQGNVDSSDVLGAEEELLEEFDLDAHLEDFLTRRLVESEVDHLIVLSVLIVLRDQGLHIQYLPRDVLHCSQMTT